MSKTERDDVNISDVAKRAGVSIATVSLALNDKGRISDKTRARIKKVAKDLGYVSNRHAAAFRTGNNKTIGYVLQSKKSPSHGAVWHIALGQILFDIVTYAMPRGYSVVAIPSGDEKFLKQLGIAGLILSDSIKNDPDYQAAIKLGIPVGTNERPDLKDLAVRLNVGYREMTVAAFDLLLERGAQSPALLTEQADLYSNYQAELAYLEWCKAKKIKPLVASGAYDRSDIEQQVNKLIDAGADAIYSFYEEGPAIVEALEKRGLFVPRDILLIAAEFDNDARNKSLGISTTVYHHDDGLDDFVNAFIDVIEGRVSPGIVINSEWELNEYISTQP